MSTIDLVLSRDESLTIDSHVFENLFGSELVGRQVKNKLVELSAKKRFRVGVMEPHEQLPNHVRELVGLWHKGDRVKPSVAKNGKEGSFNYGHTHHSPKP